MSEHRRPESSAPKQFCYLSVRSRSVSETQILLWAITTSRPRDVTVHDRLQNFVRKVFAEWYRSYVMTTYTTVSFLVVDRPWQLAFMSGHIHTCVHAYKGLSECVKARQLESSRDWQRRGDVRVTWRCGTDPLGLMSGSSQSRCRHFWFHERSRMYWPAEQLSSSPGRLLRTVPRRLTR
jgi:hypothetical protein